MTVTAMEHVLVLSDDIDATRDFYCDVVGLEVGFRPDLGFPGFWLYAGTTPCLHIAERDAYQGHAGLIGLRVPDRADGGPVDHIAFSAEDYGSVRARIEQRGLTVVHNTVPGVQRQLFVNDPNGVRIEINVKNDMNKRG